MTKYELSLSSDYVSSWTVIDAVRELFQNALDQETVEPNNEMFFEYDNGILRIGNKESILRAESLLLGVSTKRDDPTTIGKFGEGYKIASLVLLRLNKKVTFYNYGRKEVWKPKLVNSRKYGGVKILTFFVQKQSIWNKVPDNNLTIEIENITQEEYDLIVESNLHLQLALDIIATPKGRILNEDKYKGKVYVNGLFVCNFDEYGVGYDFKPAYIKIDRDRKLVSDFDLKWLSSSMWSAIAEQEPKKIVELAKEGKADVTYLKSTDYYYSSNSGAYDMALDTFRSEYGNKAIPITTQEELHKVENIYADAKPVIVTETMKHLITSSSRYTEPESKSTYISPVYKLRLWFDGVKEHLIQEYVDDFEIIYKELEEKAHD